MAHDGSLNFDTKIDSSGFKKGLNKIGSVAKAGIGLTTKVLQGATAGVTALGAAAAKVGSDFEAGMSQVQAISGASGEDLEKLKNKAKEMGAATKFSATESAEALNYMAMAGWKTEDMLGGLEGVMNLAAASGEDLATASDIVTDAMTALGMQASEAGHFSDVLAAAASNANTSVGGMGETFKYAGAMAGTLGYSVEDVALATGLMANAGIKGTMAGTSLNSIMTRLSTNTNGARDAIEELGVAFFNEDGSARSLTDVMGELREATADMTTEQKANFANTVAGMEAQKGLSAILNATEDDYNKLSAAIQNADGCALEMAETMQDNLQGQLTILQSGLEGLGISLYETFQGTAKDVVKEAQGMVQQLQDAFNAGGLDGLVSAVGDVLAQIIERLAGAAPELVNMAVSLVGSLCEGLKSAPGIGDSAASLITSLVTGLASCVDDIWTTAIVLVGKMAEGVAAGAPQMVQAISATITDIHECVAEWMPDFLQAGADILLALVDGIADALPTLAYQAAVIIEEMAMALVDNIPALMDAALQLVEGLVQGIVDAMPVLLEGSIQAFMAILEALPVVIEQLLQALPDLITAIIDFLVENTSMIVDGSVQMLMGIIEAIPAIAVAIVENLPAIINAIVMGLAGAVPRVREASEALLTSIATTLKDIPPKIGQILTEAIGRIIQWGADIQMEAQAAASGFVNNILTFLSGLPENIAHWLGYAIGVVIKWGADLAAWVMGEIPLIINSIVTFFSELPGKIWEWLVNVITRMVAWKQQMLSTAKTAISNVISSIISQLAQLPGKVTGELAKVTAGMVQWGADIVSRMTEVGKNIVSGIWNGISSGWDWLKGKVADLANSLLDGAKEALGINSPSTEFRDEFGRWLMPGAVEGVKMSMPKSLREMKAEAGKLVAAMRGTVDMAMNSFTLATANGAGLKAGAAGATFVQIDNSQKQENNYHEKVISPSEVAKNQREAFRNFQKGVK